MIKRLATVLTLSAGLLLASAPALAQDRPVSPNGARFQVWAFKYAAPTQEAVTAARVRVGSNVQFWQARFVLDVWMRGPSGYGWQNLLDYQTPLIENLAPSTAPGASGMVKSHIFRFPARLTRRNWHYRYTAYLNVQAKGGRMAEGFQTSYRTTRFRPR